MKNNTEYTPDQEETLSCLGYRSVRYNAKHVERCAWQNVVVVESKARYFCHGGARAIESVTGFFFEDTHSSRDGETSGILSYILRNGVLKRLGNDAFKRFVYDI